MLDNRSKLMKRLAEIMPKEAADRAISSPRSMRIEIHPIRQSAESFTHWLNDDLPANREELISMLWVFGEILYGDMERMLNESMRRQNDLPKKRRKAPAFRHGDISRALAAVIKQYVENQKNV